MNYQPFLDMHFLVSDDFLLVMPYVIQSLILAGGATFLAILMFLWLRKNV